jgi:hypothetical protein
MENMATDDWVILKFVETIDQGQNKIQFRNFPGVNEEIHQNIWTAADVARMSTEHLSNANLFSQAHGVSWKWNSIKLTLILCLYTYIFSDSLCYST